MPAVLPSGLEAFVDKVVPILQERGLFRTEYEGRTLRDRYGLPRPVNRLDKIVPPGVTLFARDQGYRPPSPTDPARRRCG